MNVFDKLKNTAPLQIDHIQLKKIKEAERAK